MFDEAFVFVRGGVEALQGRSGGARPRAPDLRRLERATRCVRIRHGPCAGTRRPRLRAVREDLREVVAERLRARARNGCHTRARVRVVLPGGGHSATATSWPGPSRSTTCAGEWARCARLSAVGR